MGKPHKHSAFIKAWADGAEIQFKSFEDKWISVKDRLPEFTKDNGD